MNLFRAQLHNTVLYKTQVLMSRLNFKRQNKVKLTFKQVPGEFPGLFRSTAVVVLTPGFSTRDGTVQHFACYFLILLYIVFSGHTVCHILRIDKTSGIFKVTSKRPLYMGTVVNSALKMSWGLRYLYDCWRTNKPYPCEHKTKSPSRIFSNSGSFLINLVVAFLVSFQTISTNSGAKFISFILSLKTSHI